MGSVLTWNICTFERVCGGAAAVVVVVEPALVRLWLIIHKGLGKLGVSFRDGNTVAVGRGRRRGGQRLTFSAV